MTQCDDDIPTMHLSHIPQCTIQNRNVHISGLNCALWDIGQVHCGIREFGVLLNDWSIVVWATWKIFHITDSLKHLEPFFFS